MILPILLAAAQPVAAPSSASRLGGRWRPVWGLCDGRELLVIGNPARGSVGIERYDRGTLKRTGAASYAIGRADPGAGQIFHALRQGGRDVGNIHAVNAGMIDPPPRVPAISSVALGLTRVQCRLLPGTVLIGVTAKRTVVVTREAAGLVYRAFDPGATKPTLQLRGTPDRAGALFRRGVYSYRITAAPAGGGAVLIQRSGEAIGQERFLAYSMATPAPFR